VVLLQNCIDLWNSGRGHHSGMCATSSEVGNVERVTGETEGEDRKPMMYSLIRTDPGVGFMSVECLACFISIQNCLSQYKSALVKQQFDPGEWFRQVVMTR